MEESDHMKLQQTFYDIGEEWGHQGALFRTRDYYLAIYLSF